MIALPTPNAHLFRLLGYAKAYRPQVWSVDQPKVNHQFHRRSTGIV
ncbi:hypothetical protein [Chroococcidiopsis sp. CCMEE 29]|nr:hypothetical protein [Chroococcidiopsis sp. CCMEE 29]